MSLPCIRRIKTTFVYSPNWDSIRCRTLAMQPRCTVNPMHRARIAHHLKNRRSLLRMILGMFLLHPPRRSVAGFEIPGWDVVSVCPECHENHYGRSTRKSSVHHPSVWIQRGGLDNHNVLWFRWELRLKFWVIYLCFGFARFIKKVFTV